jgi:hypothetical protein
MLAISQVSGYSGYSFPFQVRISSYKDARILKICTNQVVASTINVLSMLLSILRDVYLSYHKPQVKT